MILYLPLPPPYRNFTLTTLQPGPPHSLLWGHLKVFGKYHAKLPPNTYIQAAITQMKQDFNLPDIFYLDLWPFGPRFLICSSPESCAIPTTVNSFPQADVVTEFLDANLGSEFIEATNGPMWKELHQMIAPGLNPASVKTYHGFIVDEAQTLYERIRQFAKSGNVIDLNHELGKFPFEVLARIFFGERFDAQVTGSPLYELFRRAIVYVGAATANNNPIKTSQLNKRAKADLDQVGKDIEARVRVRFSALKQQKVLPNRTTATNILDRMLVAQVQSGQPLDDRLMKLVVGK